MSKHCLYYCKKTKKTQHIYNYLTNNHLLSIIWHLLFAYHMKNQILLLFLFFYTLHIYAQSGNTCADAIPITLPLTNNNFTTCNNQNNFDAPSPGGCFSPTETVNQYATGLDMFFYFIPTISACYNIVPYTANASSNPSVFVYDGCPEEFNCIGGSVFFLDGLFLTAGNTYTIIVSNKADASGNNCIDFQLYITNPNEAPYNDFCANAMPIVGYANNFNASSCNEPNDWAPELNGIDCFGGDWTSNENGMWYQFNNPSTQTIDITAYNINCTGINGNDNTLQMGVWTNSGLCDLSQETFITCLVAVENGTVSMPNLLAGDYYLFVDGNAASLCTWNFYSPNICIPPSVTFNTISPNCNTANGTIQAVIEPNPPPNGVSYSVLWNTGSTANVLNNVSAGTYTVTVTANSNGENCTTVATVILQNTNIPISVGNTGPVCINEPVLLSATGGANYAWAGNGINASNQNNPNPSISFNTGGVNTYTVTITDTQGCTATATTTVGVVSFPVQIDVPISACLGENVDLTAMGGSAYLWQNPSGALISNQAVATVSPVVPQSSGTYTVTVTGVAGCSNTATTQLSVGQVSANILTPTSFCAGDTLHLMATGGLSYQWSGPVGFVSNLQNPIIYPATQFDSGTYSLTVTGTNNCTATASQIINLSNASATAVNTSPVCEPNSFQLLASGGVSYNWSNTQGYTSSEQNPVITDTYINMSDFYTVTVTNANGCTRTASTMVTVNGVNPIVANNSPVCAGQNIALSANNGVSYSWSGANGFVSNLPNPTITNATIDNAGTYTVTITNANTCSTIETTTVVVSQPNISLLPNNNTLCSGQNLTIEAFGGLAYNWTLPNNISYNQAVLNVNGIMPINAGLYTVVGTDSIGCTASASTIIGVSTITPTANSNSPLCVGSLLQLNASGGSIYSWQGPDNFTSSAQNPIINAANIVNSGIYTVTVSSNFGCTAVATTLVSVNEAAASITAIPPLCAGNNLLLQANGGQTYAWAGANGFSSAQQNPIISNATVLQAGTYTVTVTDATNCTATASTNISIPNLLQATIVSQNATCFSANNGNAIANAVGGSGTLAFEWSDGSSTNTIAQLSPNSYTLTVTDAVGCTATAQTQITQPALLTVALTPTNALCFNGNGSIQSTTLGGTNPYNYTWSNSLPPNDAVYNVAPNTYTLTVTDANGCTQTAETQIQQPNPITLNANISNVLCNGATTGSIAVDALGGIGTLSYQWSDGISNTPNLSDVAAGDYTVTVTDTNQCSTANTYTISQSTPLQSVIWADEPLCFGGTGQVYISASGSTPLYGFLWNDNPQLTNDTIQATAGNYVVTITDANFCTATNQITVTQPTLISSNLTKNDATCFDTATGTISATANGGILPYNYTWSNGVNNASTINNLSAATYTLTITDANSCTLVQNINILQPDSLHITANTSPALCYQTATASISTNTTGGSIPYTYTWSNSATTPNLVGINAGNYTLTVTDVAGCSNTISVNITQPQAIETNSTATNIACNGNATGSIVTTTTGGTTPYFYTWTNSLPNTANQINSLPPNTYTVTVTDANGCSSTTSQNISQPTPITITVTTNNANCGQADGSATLNVTGGTGSNYLYQWSNNQSSTNTCSNLLAQIYSVTVTDEAACTQTISFAINNNNAPQITNALLTNTTCQQNNGSIELTVLGNGVINYEWSANANAGNTPLINNLLADTYAVTITDNNNCNAIAAYTINNEASPQLSINTQNNATCGIANGSIAVTILGGTGALTYTWSNGVNNTSAINNLDAGTYTLTVTDSNQCTATINSTITQLGQIGIDVLGVSNAFCNQANGSINTIAQNTVGAVTYTWTNNISNTATANNLLPDTYTLTITDQNNCTATQSFIVAQIAAPTVSISTVQPPTCEQANGILTATVQNENLPITYLWNIANQNTATVTNLPQGTYTVTITDQLNCIATAQIDITNQASPQITNVSVLPENCNQQNGTAQISTAGGSGALAFVWSDGVSNSPTAVNLTTGNYTVTITDQNQCTDTLTVFVPETTPPNISNTQTTNAACNQADGSATITAIGGTGILSYTWSNAAQNTPNIDNLTTGSYTVTVTDEVQCSTTQTLEVLNTNAPSVTAINTTPSTCGNSNGTAQLTVSGGTGTLTYVWANNISNTATANGLSAQTYTVTITDQSQCSAVSTLSINNQAAPQINNTQITNATCGNQNGSILLTTAGGTGALVYTWSDGVSTTNQANNLLPQTYTVTITDENACSTTATAVILNEASPQIIAAQTNNATCGIANGSITVDALGGTGALTYTWSDGVNNTPTATNLAAGTYTLTVTDTNLCTADTVLTITSTPQPQIDAVVLTPASCNSANGSITITASSGVGAFSYFWSDATIATTANQANNLLPQTYTVTVTDANACSTSTTAVVLSVNSLQITDVQTNNATCGIANGSITVDALGGTGALTYTWSDGVNNTPTATNLAAGTYTLTVTDTNLCTADTVLTIANTPQPQIDAVVLTPETCDNANGSIAITASSGVGAFSYVWSDGVSDNGIAQNLNAGTYSVTITDQNNCATTTTATIVAQTNVGIQVLSTTNTVCNSSLGQIQTQAIGGVGSLTYTWVDAVSTDSIATNLSAGTYTVTVTDQNNCTATAQATILPTLLPVQLQCSAATDSTITVSWQNVAGVDAYIIVANGQTDTLPTTTLGYTIPNLPPDTTISVALFAIGCGLTQTDTIQCNTLPDVICLPIPISITILDSLFCETDAPSSILGTPQNGVFSGTGVTNNTFYPDQANIGTNTLTYTYTAADGCIYTATKTIWVAQNPTALLAGDTVVCINQNSLFTFNGEAVDGNTYQWLINDVLSSQEISLQTTFTTPQTQQISLVVTNANGCTDTITQQVEIATLTAQTIEDTTVLFGSTLFLPVTALSNLNTPLSYTWQPPTNTLSCNNCNNPQLTISEPINNYTIVVTDNYGCIAADSVTITAKYNNQIIIPNAFSPNNDQQNDVFGIYGHNIAQYTLLIYNRWGNKVYEYNGTDTNQYWDGTQKGINCELGVYVYYATITFTNSQQVVKKGNVTLIR